MLILRNPGERSELDCFVRDVPCACILIRWRGTSVALIACDDTVFVAASACFLRIRTNLSTPSSLVLSRLEGKSFSLVCSDRPPRLFRRCNLAHIIRIIMAMI